MEAVLTANTKQFITGLAKAEGSMQRTRKIAGIAGLAIAGVLAVGIEKSVKAAEQGEIATKRLNQAFTTSGLSAKAYAAQMKVLFAAGRDLGFSTGDQKRALGSLIIATHDYAKAAKIMSVAQDVARFRGIDLQSATKMVTMAMTGAQRATKQLGLNVATSSQQALKARQAYKEQTEALKAQFPPMSKMTDAQKAHYTALKNNIDQQYAQVKSESAIQDKQLTGTKILDLVSKKLHGQAQAYADTSAGGMARFQAQLKFIEGTIGKGLLPVLTEIITKLADFLEIITAHPQALKLVVGGLAALSAALIVAAGAQALVNAVMQANPYILAAEALVVFSILIVTHWKQITDTVRGAVKAIADFVQPAWVAIMNYVVRPAQAILNFFQNNWRVITTLISGPFMPLVALATDAFGIRSALIRAFQAITTWVGNNWRSIVTLISGPFVPLVALATNAFGIRTALVNAFSSIISATANIFTQLARSIATWVADIAKGVYNWAKDIGRQMIMGIIAGIGSLAKDAAEALWNVARNAVDFVRSHLGISSPSLVTHIRIGIPMGEGIREGILRTEVSIRDALRSVVDDAIAQPWGATMSMVQTQIGRPMSDALVRGILSGKVPVSEALVQVAKNAVATAKSNVQGLVGQFSNWITAAFNAKQQAVKTPTEILISQKEAERQSKGLQDAVTQAQTDLASAQAELARAQSATTDKSGNPLDPDQKAQDIKDAQDKVVQAQKSLDDAQYNQWLNDAQAQAATERKALDQQQFVEQQNFNARLDALQNYLNSGKATAEGARKMMGDLLADFGLDNAAIGTLMGESFKQQLNAMIPLVKSAAAQLRIALEQEGIIERGRSITERLAKMREKARKKAADDAKKAREKEARDRKKHAADMAKTLKGGVDASMGMGATAADFQMPGYKAAAHKAPAVQGPPPFAAPRGAGAKAHGGMAGTGPDFVDQWFPGLTAAVSWVNSKPADWWFPGTKWIRENYLGLLTASQPLLAFAVDGFGIRTGLTNFIKDAAGLGKKIVSAIVDDGLAKLAGEAWKAIAGIGKEIADHLSDINGWSNSLGDTIDAGIITALKFVGDHTWGALKSIGTWITNKLGDVYNWSNSLGSKIDDTIKDTLKNIGPEVWDKIKAIGPVLISYAETVKGWGANVAGWIKSAVVDGLAGAAKGAVGIGVAAWNVINNIGAVIVQYAAAIKGWGADIAGWIKGAVADKLGGIGTVAWGVINNIYSVIVEHAKDIASWGGKIIGYVENGIVGALDDFKKAIKKFFDPGRIVGWIKDALLGGSPSKPLMDVGHWMIDSIIHGIGGSADALKNAVINIVKSLPGNLIGGIGGIIHGGPATGSQQNRNIGQQIAASYGWGSGAEWASLDALAMGESGWSNTAKNASSGAYGIAQALPESKYPPAGRASGGSDAATQIRWMLDYIKGRYGDPINAYQTWQSRNPHWYDEGGWLPPGLSLAMNATGKPERVLGPNETGNNYVFNFPNYVGTQDELVKTIKAALARDKRYGRSMPWETQLPG